MASTSSSSRKASGTDNGTRQRPQQVEQPLEHGIGSPSARAFSSAAAPTLSESVRASGTMSASLARPSSTPILSCTSLPKISSSRSIISLPQLQASPARFHVIVGWHFRTIHPKVLSLSRLQMQSCRTHVSPPAMQRPHADEVLIVLRLILCGPFFSDKSDKFGADSALTGGT